MVLDDGRILCLLGLVVKCLEKVDEGSPDMMRAYLEELKEELQKTVSEITPRKSEVAMTKSAKATKAVLRELVEATKALRHETVGGVLPEVSREVGQNTRIRFEEALEDASDFLLTK